MKHWYNNGNVEMLIDDIYSVPEGFTKGRKPFCESYYINMSKAQSWHKPTFTRKHTEEEKTKTSKTLKASNGTAGSFKPGHETWIKGLSVNDPRVKQMTETYKQTMQRKYGVDNYTQSEAYKQDLIKINAKIYDTKKRNNSFNTSKPERMLFDYYVKVFGEDDVFAQYVDERYPFRCDIYIKSIDLFIELNATWTHGKKPYDPNDQECVEILNNWRAKADQGSIYYKNAIKVWTELDVKKAEIAKSSGINLQIITCTPYKKIGYKYSNGLILT